MENKYSKINKNSLKGEILITSRNSYIDLIAKDFLIEKIIPIEYIDTKLNLENINKGIIVPLIIDDNLRLQFIKNLLTKECIKGTSSLIANMCFY